MQNPTTERIGKCSTVRKNAGKRKRYDVRKQAIFFARSTLNIQKKRGVPENMKYSRRKNGINTSMMDTEKLKTNEMGYQIAKQCAKPAISEVA